MNTNVQITAVKKEFSGRKPMAEQSDMTFNDESAA